MKIKPQDIDAIVVHCSATREGADIKASTIDKWHRARGLNGIGYNFVIDLDGTIEVCRDIEIPGAHCNNKGFSGKSYNYHSIGICYVGGLDANGKPKDTRTVEQKRSLLALISELVIKFPIKEILGHRDTSPDKNSNGVVESFEWMKACPSFDAKLEYSYLLCN